MFALLSLYSPSYATVLVYMLQNTEYQVMPYLKWYWRTGDFRLVIRRRKLQKTRAATLLLAALSIGMVAQIIAGMTLIGLWQWRGLTGGWQYGTALIISYSLVWAHLIIVPLLLGRWLIVWPRDLRNIHQSKAIFRNHPGIKIAVAGSYGKTSMKELLLTVLDEGKNVAATPANKNVASSHAIFARNLTGHEDILIIEYGEGKPGDVVRFAKTTNPNIGIITGLAPAHLDHYPSLEAAGQDIFSLATYLDGKQVYVNSESEATKPFMKLKYHAYNRQGVLGWKVSNIKVTIEGTSFTLKKGKVSLKLQSALIGQHHVGPLAFAAALADSLGLSKQQIEAGIAKTQPFEHRMQPRAVRGAWIIDDTYNGNIEGVRAGLELLKSLKARRHIYVTPGLVDQGKETENVHAELGKLIAKAQPDSVVLMRNSTTSFIQKGLEDNGYKGGLVIEDNPLHFYTNIDQFVASGDILLMQNDWPDNYK